MYFSLFFFLFFNLFCSSFERTWDNPKKVEETLVIEAEDSFKEKKSDKKKPTKKGSNQNIGVNANLKAGYADDNQQFNYFINFLQKYSKIARHIPISVSERIRIRALDASGRSIPNAKIKVLTSDKKKLLEEGFTYSDGSYLFFPLEYEKNMHSYHVELEYKQTSAKMVVDRQGPRNIDLRLSTENRQTEIPMDIVFVLDTTASMGEEIASLLKTIELIHLNLSSLKGVSIRFGMVLYKDKDDEYVTRVFQPTENVKEFIEELSSVTARGGGDAPEDLQSALKDAVNGIKWRGDAIKINFIITDAPPHLDYNQEHTYPKVLKQAKSQGIKFYSIGTGGLDINGEYVLRQISQYSYAKYIFLTYGEKTESEGGKPGSVSHHTGDNFSTDKLESIVIRFAKEEYSHANGRPLQADETYFTAKRVPDESKDETLQKLFDSAISQLIDFSGAKIIPQTPASVLPIALEDGKLNTEAGYLEDQMLYSFSRNSNFQLIERRDLQKIYDEWKLGQRLGIAEENALELGKMSGAKLLLISRLYRKKNEFEMYVKLVKTETGEILSVTKMVIDPTLL
jgi:Mg-chelatase subunit ChlD